METKSRTTKPYLKEEESPLRGIFCLKTRQDMKRFEETEDCFILDFDPFNSFDVKRLTFTDDKDLAIIHETGQVACRDYPHPRHLCLNFPFGSTPNATHCNLGKKKTMETKKKEEDGTPLRPIFCLKNRQEIKRFDETEDCFILDFDPSDSFDAKRLDFSDDACEGDKDVAIIHEKGQVACRDYPHPRHLCLNFPFGSTPNSSHCDMCYCYICDKPAPCAEWTISISHCNAYDTTTWNMWRSYKKTTK